MTMMSPAYVIITGGNTIIDGGRYKHSEVSGNPVIRLDQLVFLTMVAVLLLAAIIIIYCW